MTIDSGWVGIMKDEAPNAFTEHVPFHPKVAYLDGMPLLMASGTLQKWEDLVKWNFARSVKRFFFMNASVVVLAFDDYKYVPASKAITQANRSKKKVKIEFNERQYLQTVMPTNYNELLSNREYKRRVIDMIVEVIPEYLDLRMGQTFIVDYIDCPVRFRKDMQTGKMKHDYLTEIPPLGECDVKFTRWGEIFGRDIIAHSVDGDFIPIALMDYERRMCEFERKTKCSEMNVDDGDTRQASGTNMPKMPHQVAIYRMHCNSDSASMKAAALAKKNKSHGKGDKNGTQTILQFGTGTGKRNSDGELKYVKHRDAGDEENGISTATQQQRRRRTMEYVNIPALYRALKLSMRQRCPPEMRSASLERQYMRLFACFIGLTGTDFARGLPQLGPKKVWETTSMRHVWGAVLKSFDLCSGMMKAGETADWFIGKLYQDKFCRQAPNAQDKPLQHVLKLLRESKLADRTKGFLPSRERVEVTVRNVNWTIKYWECKSPVKSPPPQTKEEEENGDPWDHSGVYPDPICDEYGFKKSKGRKCAIQWGDVE